MEGESRLKNKVNEDEKKKNKVTSTFLSFSLIGFTILPIPAPSFCKKKNVLALEVLIEATQRPPPGTNREEFCIDLKNR